MNLLPDWIREKLVRATAEGNDSMNDGDDSVFGVKHFLVFHDFRMKTNFDKSVDHKPDYAQEDKGYDLMSKIMGKVKGLVKAFEHLV